MTRSRTRVLWAGILTALVGLGPACRNGDPASTKNAAADPVWFQDVTAAAGLAFVHDAGPTGRYFMPQVVGSGAALFDFDGDGRLDVYLLHNSGPGSKA